MCSLTNIGSDDMKLLQKSIKIKM